jgi:signal transduction histidine kinase/FixJ family two-component response regulator
MPEPSSASRRHRWTPYAIALLLCVAAGAAQYVLQEETGKRFPLAVLWVAVMLSALFGGVGPTIVATILAAGITSYFILDLSDPVDLIGLILFVAAGGLLSFIVRSIHRTLDSERSGRLSAEARLKRVSQLQELATSLSKAQTSDEVCGVTLSELLYALDASAGAIALVSSDGRHLEVVHAVGYANPTLVRSTIVPLASKTVLTEAVRRRAPIRFASEADRDAKFADLLVEPVLADWESGVVVPLMVSGRPIGVAVLTFKTTHVPDNDEQEFLNGAANRAAQALDRAQRYEVAERARADAEAYRIRADIELRERQKAEGALRESEGRYRALAARTNRLYTLSSGLSEAITLDAVAKSIVHNGKVVAGASAASVTLLVDGHHFEPLYADEPPNLKIEPSHRYPAEAGHCSTAVVETRRPVFIGSFFEWQQQYPRSASMAADGGYASAAVLPLLVEGSAIGVLSFHFTVPVNFDDEYKALLTSVAQHAAQALDRARLYESAQRARTEAENANRSKDDFLSIISHELRTPLSAVLGWAAMLRDQTLDPSRTRRAIEAIFNNATRQTHLIDELLDVSRIVAGRASLDLQELDLSENVRGAADAIMPLAEAKGIEVRIEQLPTDARVVADPRRLEQVFLNLLGNAVKFTNEGGVIHVEVAASDGTVDVRVSDTGRGIDREFLPQVFERFRQAESTIARSAGGLGLGLFIARRLVEAHGGSIQVHSEGEGRGSTFVVTLPAVAGPSAGRHAGPEMALVTPHETSPALPSLAGLKVLLVDDESDVREMMVSILETCGATVLPAASAEAALELMAGEAGRIDVLLSDIAMPGKNGYDLIREVRAQTDKRLATVPAAAVTAAAGSEERQRALSAGFQMHIVKPVRPEALARAVASLAGIDVLARPSASKAKAARP